MVFEDDFNGTFQDDLWQIRPYWGGIHNPGFQYNWWSEETVRMSDSTLVMGIKLDTLRYDTFVVPYAGSYVSNFKSFTQVYGYFEARCKIPKTKGIWPAFWLVSHESWPPEIDIFEFYGSKDITKLESNLHWGLDINNNRDSHVKAHKLPDPSKKFHVYGVEWNKDEIIWYFDGRVMRRQKKNLEDFDKLMHVVFDVAVMNNEDVAEGRVDTSAVMEVDYVRIYRRAGEMNYK